MRTQRIGRFSVPANGWQGEGWKEYLPIFNGLLVVKADWRPDLDVIEYLAYSDSFKEIEVGISATQYEIEYCESRLPSGDRVRTPTGLKEANGAQLSI